MNDHSATRRAKKLGHASLVVGLSSIVLTISLLVAMEVTDSHSSAWPILLSVTTIPVPLIGLGLGLASRRLNRSRHWPTFTGILLNSLIFTMTVCCGVVTLLVMKMVEGTAY